MNAIWLLIFLPIAATSGWIASWRQYNKETKMVSYKRPPIDYLRALNFVLNEQPDKALEMFTKMLPVDMETVETHLSLGQLFQRRGEMSRSIRIHQHILEQNNLDSAIHAQALFALANDYFKAGVFDRAEKLFLKCAELGDCKQESIQFLLSIYEQGKEWEKAIEISKKYSFWNASPGFKMSIAHYYCELAEIAFQKNCNDDAENLLKKAFSSDLCCVRASLLMAKLQAKNAKYDLAIEYLKKVKEQDPDYLTETIVPIVQAFRSISKEKDLVEYLKSLLKDFPRLPIIVILSEQIRLWKGDKAAVSFVTDYVRRHPSMYGIHRLIELQLPLVGAEAKNDLMLLHGLTERLVDDQPKYRCFNCGFTSKSLHWQCPSCRKWGCMKTILPE